MTCMELRHIMALQNVTHLFGIIICFLLKHIIKHILFLQYFAYSRGSLISVFLLESQIQSVVALVLCVISSILVIIQLIYTSKNLLFFVIILLPVAGNILILFFKVCVKVLRLSSFKFKDLKYKWYM